MPMVPVDTAIQVTVGPLIDDTDFKSLETGVAYDAGGQSVDLIEKAANSSTKTDITLSAAGANDWVELGSGMYSIEITAAQNNTEGTLQVVGVATGILPYMSPVYSVVPVKVYNSLVAGSDSLEVDTIALSGDTTAADNAELMFDGTGYAGGSTKLDVNIASSDNIDFGATQKASINTEVDNALDTSISELGVAAPTATPTVRTALMLMYMALRNKLVVQTSGTDALELYNNAGTKIAAKTITDDGSDYTEAEMA